MSISVLLWTTVAASLLDSLNPIAIAQQFALQSMATKKRDIVAFIVGIGLTNYVAGALVYFGVAAVMRAWLDAWLADNHGLVRAAALAAGLLCVVAGALLAYRKWGGRREEKGAHSQIKKPVSLSAGSLFTMGILFCFFELSSALPYYAYLALFAQVRLPVPAALAILLLYNLLFSLPLILMLIASVLMDDKLDRVYAVIQRAIGAILRVAPPVLLAALGGAGILYGAGVL